MTIEKPTRRIPLAERFRALALIMNGRASSMPEFPAKYYVVRFDGGRRLYLKGGAAGEVKFTCQEEISHDIINYVFGSLDEGWHNWTASTVDGAFNFWATFTAPIEMPAPWRWIFDDGLTFHQVPFAPMMSASMDSCPHFKEMMSRSDNAKAVMQWIGSIFDPASDLQQYLWIYGHGNDGKGSLARFLSRVLASATTWQQPPQRGDKFWTHGLIGKRLVVYGDCNEAGFVTSGIFKSMTGGDLIRVEEKGGPTFSVKMQAKHLFLSNKRPTIDGDRADQRRIIYCEMESISGDSAQGYEEILWREGAAFLGICMRLYEELAGATIPVEKDASERLASMKEEELEYAVERYFEISPAHRMGATEFHAQSVAAGFRSPNAQGRFFDYLNRVFGIKKLREATGKREWFYTGLASKAALRDAREKDRW